MVTCYPFLALDELASERAGEIVVAKLDTEHNPQTAGRFGIRGIPTLVLLVGGREAGRVTGAVGRPQLEQLVGQAGKSR